MRRPQIRLQDMVRNPNWYRSLAGALLLVLVVAIVAALAVGCGKAADSSSQTTQTTKPTEETASPVTTVSEDGYLLAMSDVSRLTPSAPKEDVSAAVDSMLLVGLDLYQVLASQPETTNLVLSPASIATALAMTYAGAAGSTAEEMARYLHFKLTDDSLHAAFNALDQELKTRNWESTNPEGKKEGVLLRTANSLWGQKDLQFEPSFLDLLAAHYGAGMRLVDFATAPEEARQAINAWVAKETEKKIPELIPKGVIDVLTRLVLVNAIYLDATWASQFNPDLTHEGQFTKLEGTTMTVPMMNQTASFPYAAADGWQAVELPYAGDQLAMVLLVPDQGRFPEVEKQLQTGLLSEVFAALSSPREVALTVPKFTMRTQADLDEAFRTLGMKTPFDPGLADFSKMTKEEQLYITDIIHEAYIAVDEEGTEAAAATAVVIGKTAMPIDLVELVIDRPFIFALRDRGTGALLFLGRVLEPGQ